MTTSQENFKLAMRNAGIEPPATIEADGKLHRFTVADDKPRSENGWYVFHGDGSLPAGAFGCWKRQVNETWSGKEYRTLTTEEKAAYSAKMEAIKQQREQEQIARRVECISKAQSMLKSAKEPDASHAYLTKKGIKPFGAKQLDDLLLVPIRKNKELTGLQIITQDGTKRFLSGTEKHGAYLAIAGNGDTVYLCEGWATGCTIHEATGATIIVCFDCGNLEPVAKEIKAKGPEYKLVVCADNDSQTEGNPGVTKATEAALLVGCLLAVPIMPPDCGGTDYNDLHQSAGLDEVKRQLSLAVEPQQRVQGEAGEPSFSIKGIPNLAAEYKNPLTDAVDRLAKLSALEYDQVRKDEAKALGVRPGTLDAAIKAAQKEKDQKSDTPFHEVEPHPEPVDGDKLLADLLATVKRFIVCEHHTAVATSLWIAMSWFVDVIRVAPLAVITAPEKQCGKTTLLELIGRLVPRPLTSSSISPSALFRSLDLWKPTLLIDEVDACLKDNEELRGLLNSGHTRTSAYTIRCVGEDHTPTMFNTWGCKVLSGIGHVADTLMDRSIILELRRKLPHESIDRLHHATESFFHDLSARLARFSEDNASKVGTARPPLPQELSDRARDNWEPLLSIAIIAGGDWLQIGTAAAEKMAGCASVSPTIGAELLTDIQDIFHQKDADRISTTDLIQALVSDEEKPWRTYNRGFQITPRQLSTKLKGYGVYTKTIRIGNGTHKGYEKDQFKEVFSRYIPTPPSKRVTRSQCNDSNVLTPLQKSNRSDLVTFFESANYIESKECYLVTDKIPPSQEKEVFDLTNSNFEVTP